MLVVSKDHLMKMQDISYSYNSDGRMLPSVSGHWGVTDLSCKGGRPLGEDRVVYDEVVHRLVHSTYKKIYSGANRSGR